MLALRQNISMLCHYNGPYKCFNSMESRWYPEYTKQFQSPSPWVTKANSRAMVHVKGGVPNTTVTDSCVNGERAG